MLRLRFRVNDPSTRTAREAGLASAVPVVVAAILLVLLATYIVGYFTLADRIYYDPPQFRRGTGQSGYRMYPHIWMALVFAPGAAFESALTGNAMRTGVSP
jgi:hypothetical protein